MNIFKSKVLKYKQCNIPILIHMFILLVVHINVGFTATSTAVHNDHNCTQTKRMNRTFIDCSGRNLSGIPSGLPTDAYELDISNNPLLKISNGSFRNLTRLEHLKMTDCQIKYLERNSFYGLSSLVFLDLSLNFLQEKYISEFAFKPLISLTKLVLDENYFHIEKKYPDKALSYLNNLSSLSIEAISECVFPQGFRNLSSLTSLTLSSSRVDEFVFKNDTISVLCSQSLKYFTIHIHNGYLHFIDIGIFNYCNKLAGLNIFANNNSNLKMILASMYGLQGQVLEYIVLGYCNKRFRNKPISITVQDVKYLKHICVKSLDLQSNSVNFDSHLTAALMSLEHKECLEEINISLNIFVFELSPLIVLLNSFRNITRIDMYKMRRLADNSKSRNSKHYDDDVCKPFGNINKSRDTGYQLNSNDMISVSNMSYSGTIDIYIPPCLEYINASFLNIIADLPAVTVHGGKLKTLDLAYANFGSCEGEIRGMAQLINFNMSGWCCINLNPKLIQNLTALETLYATECKLGKIFPRIKEQTFLKGLKNLSVVNFSNNQLLNLHLEFFEDQYSSLRELYLGANKFENIPIDTSKFLHLTLIDLSNNLIATINKTEREQLDILWSKTKSLEINLEGDRLQCTCAYVDFLRWMNGTKIKFRNIAKLMCLGNKQQSTYIQEIIGNFHSFDLKCISYFWLTFSVVSFSLLIVALVVSALGYRYRFLIEYTFLRIRRWLKKNQPILEDYEYDVFIGYSSHDSNWVVNVLYPKLQESFNVCLYEKDFIPGISIADNIINAIDTSKKVMFVVTKDFLESSWGNYEMEMTRMHAFQNGRDNMVIILLKEKIKLKDMPKVLKNIWWKVVCLQWEDNTVPEAEDLFWTKLRNSILY